MLDFQNIRLEILKSVIPQASKVGMTEPKYIVETCLHFEKYVLGSDNNGEVPDSPPKRKGGRPKRTTDKTLSLELDPAIADKSN